MQEETREKLLAVPCENRFRMKLDAVHGELAMAQRHDFAVLAFGDDLEACREGISLDDERVISTGFKWCGQIGKESAPVMSDFGRLAMHKNGSACDFSPIRFGDALMSKTNAEDRNFRAKAENKVFADSCFTRRARAR